MRRRAVIILPAAILAVLAAAWFWTQPAIGAVNVQRSGAEIAGAELPIVVDRPVERLDVWFTLRTRALRVARYRLVAAGCLDQLTVNDRPIVPAIEDVCALSNGALVDLSDALRTGRNGVHVRLRDARTASLRFEPSAVDPLRVLLALAMLACAAWIAVAIAGRVAGDILDRGTVLIAIGGAALRVVYVLGTYYSERAHDTGPHIDYAKYLATHLRLPPAGGGWEFFQPPLYYAVAAAWLRAGAALGQTTESILSTLQFFSLLCSLATFGAVLWIGAMLFPSHADRPRRRLFVLVVSLGRMNSADLAHEATRLSHGRAA